MSDDDWMEVEEALQHIMRVTGKTRRQAKVALVQALRAGKIDATGTNTETGERELIPSEVWPAVN